MLKIFQFIDSVIYRVGGVFGRYWYLLTILGAVCYFRHDELTAFGLQTGNPWPASELESFLMMVLSPLFIWYQRVWAWCVNDAIKSYYDLKRKCGGDNAP